MAMTSMETESNVWNENTWTVGAESGTTISSSSVSFFIYVTKSSAKEIKSTNFETKCLKTRAVICEY